MCTRIFGCQSRRYYVGSYTAHCLIQSMTTTIVLESCESVGRDTDMQTFSNYTIRSRTIMTHEREGVSLPSCRLVPIPLCQSHINQIKGIIFINAVPSPSDIV